SAVGSRRRVPSRPWRVQWGPRPSKVELVELAQITPVRLVDLIEPLHELVRDLLAERIVEPFRQLGGYRHRFLHEAHGGQATALRPLHVGKRLLEGADPRRVYARRGRRVKEAQKGQKG